MDKVPNIFDIGFTKSFELAFNTVLKLDEMQGRAFEALDGKVIELWIAPSKTPLFCLINNRQIACQQYLDGDADATLKTGMRQLVNLTQGEPLEYRLIQGDESLAKDFAHAMQSVEIDWEEHLSHLTGDLVAFKVGHSIRSFLDYKKQTKQYMGTTLKEYLQFEINALPTKRQVEHFSTRVEETLNQVNQIEARINALQNKL